MAFLGQNTITFGSTFEEMLEKCNCVTWRDLDAGLGEGNRGLALSAPPTEAIDLFSVSVNQPKCKFCKICKTSKSQMKYTPHYNWVYSKDWQDSRYLCFLDFQLVSDQSGWIPGSPYRLEKFAKERIQSCTYLCFGVYIEQYAYRLYTYLYFIDVIWIRRYYAKIMTFLAQKEQHGSIHQFCASGLIDHVIPQIVCPNEELFRVIIEQKYGLKIEYLEKMIIRDCRLITSVMNVLINELGGDPSLMEFFIEKFRPPFRSCEEIITLALHLQDADPDPDRRFLLK